MIPAAEYARRIGIGKNRISVFLANGMPHREGKDGHGRLCKLIDPPAADAWRAANVTPKVDGQGRMRGLVEGPTSTAPAGTATPTETPPVAPQSAERIQSARAEGAELDLETRRTRLETQKGRLVDRAAAMDAARGFAGAVRTQIERMAADSAAVVAAELGVPEHAAYTALKRVAHRMEEDLARTSRSHGERIAAAGRG